MNLLKEFQTYVAKEGLFEPKHKLLLAISGGLDSMVLLHLLERLNYQVSCAHVNFQLRGEESMADALFVKEYCHSLHIPFLKLRLIQKNTSQKVAKARKKQQESFVIIGLMNYSTHILLILFSLHTMPMTKQKPYYSIFSGEQAPEDYQGSYQKTINWFGHYFLLQNLI